MSVLTVLILFFGLSVAAAFGDLKPQSIANEHVERKLAFDDKPVTIQIDCGADHDDSIDTGIKRSISSSFINNVDEAEKTLRSFPIGTRNCYALKPEGAKINKKYLVRASFIYGNYDNLNQVPIFDLHIGVNKWTTVDLEKSSSTIKHYKILYASSTLNIDVCLVHTGSGVPFISELELWALADSMYEIELGSSLLCNGQYDLGTAKSSEDIYGRQWDSLPTDVPGWSNYDKPFESQGDDGNNRVPDIVWSTAACTDDASMSLLYNQTLPYGFSNQFHMYFYFAEVIKDEQQREMKISLNGEQTKAVTLEQYLSRVTVGPLKKSVTSFIEFSIDPANNLPPILNAFELFVLNELPNQPTDPEDVDAMMKIKNIFKVTRNWQGDPCVPDNLSWEGANCTSDNPPRIISLNLSSSSLTGELPASLSWLTAIQSLDLSGNELTGPLPDFLAQMNELRILNLSRNKLRGSVPSDLKKKFEDTPYLLRLDGNQLCLSGSCNTQKSQFLVPVVASLISFLFIVFIIVALGIFLRYKRQIQVLLTASMIGSLKSKNRRFSYSEIKGITDGLKNVIGEGAFGKVYHGVLKDKTQVAVKILSKSSNQGPKEFQAEAQLLMIVHHKNLVSLVGYCNEDENMGLIYEYMPNGNLQQHLSGAKGNILNWRERLQIAIDSAQGLEYLHNGCNPPVVHRDLKPANILLDKKMRAKIADFGLSRTFSIGKESDMEANSSIEYLDPENQSTMGDFEATTLPTENVSYINTNPAGTPGYLDPEYIASGILYKRVDVYSFGVILLELITGKCAIIRDSGNEIHIRSWINPRLEGDICNIVDPRLQGRFSKLSAQRAVDLAMLCVQPTVILRPDMTHVLAELQESLEEELNGTTTYHSLEIGSVEIGE